MHPCCGTAPSRSTALWFRAIYKSMMILTACRCCDIMIGLLCCRVHWSPLDLHRTCIDIDNLTACTACLKGVQGDEKSRGVIRRHRMPSWRCDRQRHPPSKVSPRWPRRSLCTTPFPSPAGPPPAVARVCALRRFGPTECVCGPGGICDHSALEIRSPNHQIAGRRGTHNWV